jgi:hypothetical protein
MRTAWGEPPGRELPPTAEKSERVAWALTLGGIVVPAVMITVGATSDVDEGGLLGLGAILTIPGPAVGHWYAHEAGWFGMGTRFLALALIGGGLSEIDTSSRGQADVGRASALAVDDSRGVHVSDSDYTNHHLKYAYREPGGSWSTATCDQEP